MYLQFSLGFHFGIKPYLFFLLLKYIKRNVKKLYHICFQQDLLVEISLMS